MSITFAICIITCVVSFQGFKNPDFRWKLIFHPYTIKRNPKEWTRFFTSGFIHLDWAHLAFNMLALYSFGKNLEEYYYPMAFGQYAKMHYIILYFGALIVSVLASYIKNKDNQNYAALGASGAISAVVFACILFNPLSEILLFFIPMKGIYFAIIYLAFSSYASKKNLGNIGHDAHFFGAIFGLVYTLVFKPEIFYWFVSQLKTLFN